MRHLRIVLPAISILIAALACQGTAPDSAPAIGDFPTATPGGRISISLLTPTQTFEAYEGDDQQVIGPVATQTASAAQAATATAAVVEPTPTVAGVFTEAAACPPRADPTLPEVPPAFPRYAEVMASYLSAGGAPTVLEATLRSWNAITEQGGLVLSDRDLTGDGIAEIIVVAFDPANVDRTPQPGDMFIFGCRDAAYRLLYRSGFVVEESIPQLIAAEDINGNLISDIVYTKQTCDTRFCYQNVEIVEWSLALDSFDRLVTERITEPFASVDVIDQDEDGIREIVVNSGTLASNAAGPQRVFTEVWKWDSEQGLYTRTERTGASTQYRIHVLHDADAAAREGVLNSAMQLYRQAIRNTTLQSWEYPDEEEHLIAYAHYRLMLTQIVAGNETAARQTFDDLYDIYHEEPEDGDPILLLEPGVEIYRMAEFWREEYQRSGDVGAACEVVIGYIRLNPTIIEVLNTFGYANPTYSAVDVCPFGVVE